MKPYIPRSLDRWAYKGDLYGWDKGRVCLWHRQFHRWEPAPRGIFSLNRKQALTRRLGTPAAPAGQVARGVGPQTSRLPTPG